TVARAQLRDSARESPRFVLNIQDRLVDFPEHCSPHEPSDRHFKLARKQIALLAKAANVHEGRYELEDAKRHLNRLRDAMLADLDFRCSAFNGLKVLPFLVERIEALQNDYWEKVSTIKLSLKHQVDYDRD